MHRLDIVTFGLMVMALNKPAHRHISKQFERRETAKTYQAIFNEVQQHFRKINLPLLVTGQTAQNKWSIMIDGKQR
tara:strand:+ start:725 stop:952 length:228 start_codon:yes stop_codon:yes gene_type:complete